MFEKELAGDAQVHFNTYAGCTHGFGSRPTGEVEIAAQKQAHLDVLEWLKTNF